MNDWSSSALYLHYSQGLDWLPPQGGGLQVCWGGGGCRQSKKACVQWAAPTYDIYISLHITRIFHRLYGVPVRQNKRGDGRIEIT